MRPLLRPDRLRSASAAHWRRTTAPKHGAGAARAHRPEVLATAWCARQPASRASAPAGSAVALVHAPSSAPKAGFCASETRKSLAVRTLPVAWPTFGAVALAVARGAPLRRAPATLPTLFPLCRSLLPRAFPANGLAAFESSEAGHERGILGLGWPARLAIAGHGPSRDGRWALGGVMGLQCPRRVGEAQ